MVRNNLIKQQTKYWIIIYLKNIQFSNMEVRLQTFFSRMFLNLVRFQWYILLSILILLSRFKCNTDWHWMYQDILPSSSTSLYWQNMYEYYQINVNESDCILKTSKQLRGCATVTNYSFCLFFFLFFLRWKAKFFREIFKNTWPSATLTNGKLCYKVSEVKG